MYIKWQIMILQNKNKIHIKYTNSAKQKMYQQSKCEAKFSSILLKQVLALSMYVLNQKKNEKKICMYKLLDCELIARVPTINKPKKMIDLLKFCTH